MRRDLVAGELSAAYSHAKEPLKANAIVVDLLAGPPRQRIEVWYTNPPHAADLEATLRKEADKALISIHLVQDGGLIRVISIQALGDRAT